MSSLFPCQSHPFMETFKRIYIILPHELRKNFWYTSVLSAILAGFELTLAFAVSFLGVALATPEVLTGRQSVIYLLKAYPSVAPILHDQRLLIGGILLCIILTLFLKLLFSQYVVWRQGRLAQSVSKHINQSLFSGYLYGSYLWHVNQETSVLQSYLKWCEQLATFMIQILNFLTYLSIALLLVIGVIITAPTIGSLVLVITGASGFLVYKWGRRRTHKLSKAISQAQLEIDRVTLPALQGIREVLIYRQQEEFLALSEKHLNILLRLRPKLNMMEPFPSLVLELVGMVMLYIGVLVMTTQNASLAYMTGTLTLMAAVAWRLLPTMNRFIGSLICAQSTIPYVRPLLDRLDEILNFGGSAAIETTPCPLNRDIVLRNVSFRYPGTQAGAGDALHNASLTIPKGFKVGFIGASGAGKSTLVGLLTGLFAPTQGSVRIDGIDLTPERQAGWMNGIGYVPQSTFLLNATIAQNIAFSKWGEKVDRDRVSACCQMAAMHFVNDLPDGVDTTIGERGVRLSGGQVQRISVARALYNNPQALIFDEATSSLDGASEREIMEMIENLDKEITVIVVAHRLTTVERCNYLYWLHNGTVHMHGESSVVLEAYKSYLNATASADPVAQKWDVN